MIIGPKEHKTSCNARHIIRTALEVLIKKEQRRLTQLGRPRLREQCEDDIARAQDLLIRFEN